MAQLLKKAQPGDIITAQDWNLVVDAINELLQSGQQSGIKIAALLPGGTVIDPLRVGTIQQITGQNFGFSIGQSKVTFESGNTTATVFRAQMLAGSFDERLLFMMPPVDGLTPAGMNMTMRVNNGVAEDTRSVFVMPVVIDLTGDMFVTFRPDTTPFLNPNPNPIETGKPAEFRYRFQTGINQPATFNLSAEIPNATVTIPPGFADSIQFLEESGQPISNKQLAMGKNEIKNLVVLIPNIPAALASQSFTLKVTAASGTVIGTDQRGFPVGTPVTPPDPNIEANQTGFTLLDMSQGGISENPNPSTGILDGTTIKLKITRRGVVNFSTRFTKAGTYDITVQPKPGTPLANWAPEITPDSVGTRVDATRVTVVVGGDGDQTLRTEKFRVTPIAGATPTGTIVFRIKRQGAPSDFSKEFTVQLLP